ncbi:MAG TPA: potassium transporter KefA, partial [Pirellulales bacterium]|nr:potassium transporter KefA [Pirellulales bacterium]
LIVPNKEFITGKLVNWTLSDSVLRVVVAVGVDYDSDPLVVTRILLQIAREHPSILEEPAPSAVLHKFGDNALEFELRCYVSGMDKLSPVQHDLHVKIEERLRKAGIEIAYPHCDVRVRELAEPMATAAARALAGPHGSAQFGPQPAGVENRSRISA